MADMFSPYQIDYNVKNTSKTFGFSKKKVTFKFGIANQQALADRLTGANCRGSEHEVIFTWSLNSGKRQILVDGKDVHYSETGQNGWTADQVFQHHFMIRVPGLSAPLRAHLITQPANRDIPQIKPFDLRVNGISYFQMSKIYQLGTPQMVSRPVHRSKGGSGRRSGEEDAYLSPDERKAIAAAKLASLKDLQQSQQQIQAPEPAPAAAEGDLISLLDDPVPPPPAVGTAMGSQPHFASSMTMDSSFMGQSPSGPGTAPPPAAPYPQQPYSNYSLGGSFSSAPPPPPQPAAQPPQPQTSFGSMQSPYASQSSFGSAPPQQAAVPAPFGQPGLSNSFNQGYTPQQQQPPQPQQQSANGYYGYQQPQQQQQPPQQQQPYGAPQAQPSPSNYTMASYQSYGSAPTFAQPPQQQQQQQYPQYGAPPQGYPQY